MIRTVVSIDEERCNGCGECVAACEEGAIRIVDGNPRDVGCTKRTLNSGLVGLGCQASTRLMGQTCRACLHGASRDVVDGTVERVAGCRVQN